MVLTVSFVLFPVTGLVCHRRLRDCRRKLDASVGASEPHDFAVRGPSPQKPLDGPGTGRAEASAKADQAPLVLRHPASIASRPAFVTIASRPSCRGGTVRLNKAASTQLSSDNSENPKTLSHPSWFTGRPYSRASALFNSGLSLGRMAGQQRANRRHRPTSKHQAVFAYFDDFGSDAFGGSPG